MRRDIVKVLRTIGERRARLDKEGGLALAVAKGEVAIGAAVVSAMISEGLLARRRDHVARTDAGRAYLRRALAGGGEDAVRAQHQVPVVRAVAVGPQTLSVTANAAESPLAWLAHRRDRAGEPLITAVQFAAGQRLFADHERGHQRARVTSSWDPSGVRGSRRRDGLTVSEAVHDARRRVEAALAAVGPGLAEALVGVCCEGLGLEAVEKKNGWPLRSGKIVLRLALDRLAAHYGLAPLAMGGGSRSIVQWGTTDYRPAA